MNIGGFDDVFHRVSGLIPIFGGIMLILLARGMLPAKDPERMELWRRKFGTMAIVLGPISIFFGLLNVLGIF